jgi:hypothetical protein
MEQGLWEADSHLTEKEILYSCLPEGLFLFTGINFGPTP